jgi:hypothetical protein
MRPVTFRQRVRLGQTAVLLSVLLLLSWWVRYGPRPATSLALALSALWLLTVWLVVGISFPQACPRCGGDLFLRRVRIGYSHFTVLVRRHGVPFFIPKRCQECGCDLDRAWTEGRGHPHRG